MHTVDLPLQASYTGDTVLSSPTDKLVVMVSDHTVRGELVLAFREHWPYFKFALAMFIIGVIVGILMVDRIDLLALLGVEDFEEVFPDEFTTLVILVNNSIVFILALVGVLSFGLLTVVILLINGILVGYVATPIAIEEGVDFLIVGLLPHGILELPAFFVAAAVTFRLLHRFILRVTDRRERLVDPGEARRIALLLIVAWIALAIAAAIEVHVTVWLLETLYPDAGANTT